MVTRRTSYKVVINHEEQYSIIRSDQVVSAGWKEVGKTGSKEQCLEFIEEVWTDMKTTDRYRILKNLND